MPASLAETLYAAWRDSQPVAITLTWEHLADADRAAWERVAEVAREQCQPAIVGYRCVCGIDHAFETRETAVERLTVENERLLGEVARLAPIVHARTGDELGIPRLFPPAPETSK